VLSLLVAWGVVAYLVAPRLWEAHFGRDPDSTAPRGAGTDSFAGIDRVTRTSDEHPGDPIDVALAGAEEEVIRAMTAAGWFPADPITFDSSVRIALDSVLRRPDDEAPVSSLYLFGRKQDLAFEQPVGDSPRQRHHVRFWRSDRERSGRTVWFGSATFDERVGLSYTTGQVTHHIGPDVDAERDRIASELQAAGWVEGVSWVDGFHRTLEGRNGGGDPWRTDGRLAVVLLRSRAGAPAAKGSGASER
jgi:LssY C-terminus